MPRNCRRWHHRVGIDPKLLGISGVLQLVRLHRVVVWVVVLEKTQLGSCTHKFLQ